MLIRPRTVRAAVKVLKQALTATKKYGPLVAPAIKAARQALRESKKTLHEFREFRRRSPAARQPVGLQLACVDCVKTIADDLIARDRWCIARLGELCLRCHRKVDPFGRAVD